MDNVDTNGKKIDVIDTAKELLVAFRRLHLPNADAHTATGRNEELVLELLTTAFPEAHIIFTGGEVNFRLDTHAERDRHKIALLKAVQQDSNIIIDLRDTDTTRSLHHKHEEFTNGESDPLRLHIDIKNLDHTAALLPYIHKQLCKQIAQLAGDHGRSIAGHCDQAYILGKKIGTDTLPGKLHTDMEKSFTAGLRGERQIRRL